MKKLILFFNCCISCFICADLSIEEKVGQLLMVHFNGDHCNEDARMLIEELHVGGIIYFKWANELSSFEQVKHLSHSLQNLPKIPLFIGIDQEGGSIQRLSNGFTQFPSQYAIYKTENPELAYRAAYAIGSELRSAGINVNFAPVVDIYSNPLNTVIGYRAFGNSPENVIKFGLKSLEGFRDSGIFTVLKHFPGHGNTELDSHYSLPILNKTREELFKFEVYPFQSLSSKADMVMTAHIKVPAIDPNFCATLSPKFLAEILRNHIHFEGIIITDSLVMKGVSLADRSFEEIAIQSLEAGADLLLLGGKQDENELTVNDIRKIHHAIVNAIHSERLSMEAIEKSVERILSLKKKIFDQKNNPFFHHQHLANFIADSAREAKIFTQKPNLVNKRIAIIAPEPLEIHIKSGIETSADALMNFFSLEPTLEESNWIVEHARDAEVLIIFPYRAWKYPLQFNLIEELIKLKDKTKIFIRTKDQLDQFDADLCLDLYSEDATSIARAFKWLIE